MELRYLRYFLAVAATGSFTRAAAQCYVAQSALSEQIARLESEVGTQLFVRTSRTVRLTAAGEVLVPLAQRILADVETAQAELDALAGLRRGRLRLGLIQTSGGPLDLAAVLGDFHRRFAEIEFEVTSEPSAGMVTAVSAGTLDLAIVGLFPEDVPAGLERQLLSRDPLVAVVAPGLAAPSRCRSRVTAAGTADRDGNDSSMNSNRLTSGSMTAEVAGAGSSVLSWPIRAWPDQVASTRPEPPASRTVALSMVAGAILVLVSWYS